MIEKQREDDQLESLGGGRFAVRGALTFESATNILERSKVLFADSSNILVDMSDVQEADSAGLALLIEWLSWAQRSEREIAYENVPDQITAIAEISEVSDLLKARMET